MKTGIFIAIVLLSGCFAGIIYGALNLAIVEPYLDEAINIENQNMFSSGEEKDGPEFWVEYYEYRTWQKGGEILAGAILGTSIGSLFGIHFRNEPIKDYLPNSPEKASLKAKLEELKSQTFDIPIIIGGREIDCLLRLISFEEKIGTTIH